VRLDEFDFDARPQLEIGYGEQVHTAFAHTQAITIHYAGIAEDAHGRSQPMTPPPAPFPPG
jgi:hypothetical protein